MAAGFCFSRAAFLALINLPRPIAAYTVLFTDGPVGHTRDAVGYDLVVTDGVAFGVSRPPSCLGTMLPFRPIGVLRQIRYLLRNGGFTTDRKHILP